MAAPQPDYDLAIQHFRQWLNTATIQCRETLRDNTTIPGFSFVPHSAITAYFQPERISGLLRLFFANGGGPSPRDIAQRCPRGFCILLFIGRGQYIGSFAVHEELWDEHLPFFRPGPDEFPVAHEDPELFNRFFDEQWRFCPNTLERIEAGSFKVKREKVLPLLSKTWVASGVTASLHHIVVHRDYDRLKEDGGGSTDFEYALKTYRGRYAERYYRTEVHNFAELTLARLNPTPGLIGFYGGFEHGDTFNILLEYANGGTLEDMFQNRDPPSCGEDIVVFWTAFVETLKALASIHDLEKEAGDTTGSKVFQGWHQDIKPKNILVVNREDAVHNEYGLKLADLGLSHFERVSSDESDGVAEDTRGTRTYGAPELHRRSEFDETRPQLATRSIDIWSMGCVMLEACIWIVRGKALLNGFREERSSENRSLGSTAGDCFHDGKKPSPNTLQCVIFQLTNLEYDRRVSDYLTCPVLDAVRKTLRPYSKQRPTVNNLLADMENALTSAHEKLKEHYPTQSSTSPALRRETSSPKSVKSTPLTPTRSQHSTLARAPTKSSTVTFEQFPPDRPMFTGGQMYGEPAAMHNDGGAAVVRYGSTQARAEAQVQTLQSNAFTAPTRAPSVPFGQRRNPNHAGGHDYTVTGASEDPVLPHRRGQMSASSAFSTGHQFSSSGGSQFARPMPEVGSSSFPNGFHVPHSEISPAEWTEHPPEVVRGGRVLTPEVPAPLGSPAKVTNRGSKGYQKKRAAAPFLSVSSAINWRAGQKKVLGTKPALEHERFRWWLNNRDHIFLVDDATSMQRYWPHLRELLEPLTYLVKDGDPDGAELHFTISTKHVQSKRSKDLVALVDSHRPMGDTNIEHRLGNILQEYRGKLRDQTVPAGSSQPGRTVRPATIYVLTDAVWAEGNNAKGIIEETIRVLQSLSCDRKQLGIQFISFGQHLDGLRRLRELDEFGKLPHIGLDIVDTEDHQRNVWKMLLGSIDQTFDEDSEDEEC
ncbi:hypothetical protein LTR85_005287 [Meristemomyces frigidus]|nr:hypothetical protein LTR85_005287 [Meristemomyces frigidus]